MLGGSTYCDHQRPENAVGLSVIEIQRTTAWISSSIAVLLRPPKLETVSVWRARAVCSEFAGKDERVDTW